MPRDKLKRAEDALAVVVCMLIVSLLYGFWIGLLGALFMIGVLWWASIV